MNNQPLFLRFISLLIDDSNKMMGNGLEVLQKIRVTEHKVEFSGLFDKLRNLMNIKREAWKIDMFFFR